MRYVAFVALIVAAPAFAQRKAPAATGWHTDYAAARAEAKRSGKPLFVVFRCEP
jgi:hypothetical protein